MKKMFNLKRLTLIAVVFMMVFVAFSSIDFINSAKATAEESESESTGGTTVPSCPCGTSCTQTLPGVPMQCHCIPCGDDDPDDDIPDDDIPDDDVHYVDDDDPLPPLNNPPVAVADSKSVAKDSSLNRIYVLFNDNDPDGDPLFIFSVQDPPHGTTAINGLYVEYTPDPGYDGGDSFTYTISDGRGGTDSATVTVTVNTVNQPPEANNDFANVLENSADNQINVLNNDFDPDGDTIGISAPGSGSASHGSTSTDGLYMYYTPDLGYSSGDSFTYTISDGNGGTDSATVTVSITPFNPGDEEKPDIADAKCYRVLLEVPTQPSTQSGLQVCYLGIDYEFKSQLGKSYGGNALIKFKFNWGDGDESPEWIGPYHPDDLASDTHQWAGAGIYDVRVKALVDPNPTDGDLSDQVETDWSKPLPIIVQHTSEMPDDPMMT